MSRRWLVPLSLAALAVAASCSTGGAPLNEQHPVTAAQQLRAAYVDARQSEGAGSKIHAAHLESNGHRSFVDPTSGSRAEIDADATTLSRTGEDWSTRLVTKRLGCAANLSEVRVDDSPRLGAMPNRIETTKKAGGAVFQEWEVSGPLGLEQGWTLRERPCSAAPDARIEVHVEGLTPFVRSEGGVDLRDGGGATRMHYTDLWARDADLRPLPARMSVDGDVIALDIDLREARFPVEVDPLAWFDQTTLAASDGAGHDGMGGAAAMDNGTAVLGARFGSGLNAEQGAAYVFVKTGTTWVEQQKLLASDGQLFDGFGGAVALSGNTIVVGAPGAPTNDQTGRAYVFTRTGNVWTQQQTLVSNESVTGSVFGTAVALTNGVIFVGAPCASCYQAGHPFPGAVYVFGLVSGAWTPQQKLVPSDTSNQDLFGQSLAVSGTNLLVGRNSAAYAFVLSNGTWSQQQKLVGSDTQSTDSFGVSVAVSGTNAIVGAPGATISGHTLQGSAYVFVQSSASWSQQAKLVASDGAASDSFGCSVGVSGTTGVVGAFGAANGLSTGQGKAYVFDRPSNTWSPTTKLVATDGASGDSLGTSIAMTSTSALIGASSVTVGKNKLQGVGIYFGLGPPNGIPCTQDSDCGSIHCIDQVCCDRACDGICEACSAQKKASGKDDGTCGPAADGINPHNDPCPVDPNPQNCGPNGTCDGQGSGVTHCRAHPPKGAQCNSTCVDSRETDGTCDSSNTCVMGLPKTCPGGFACGALACKTSCASGTSDQDCQAGFACGTDGKCAAKPGTCTDDHTVTDPGGKASPCEPYKCANGACLNKCESVSDCAAPFACAPDGTCVQPPPNSGSGGCQTGLARHDSGSPPWLAVALCLGLGILRRRTR